MKIDGHARDHAMAPEVRLTASLIQEKLDHLAVAGFPRLIDSTASMAGSGPEDADFVIEIAPAMTMLMNFHAPIYGYDLAGKELLVADLFCEQAVKASQVAADLKVKMEVISSCARSLLDDARACDLPVRLISIHVSQLGFFWVDPHDAQFLVTIETLGPSAG